MSQMMPALCRCKSELRLITMMNQQCCTQILPQNKQLQGLNITIFCKYLDNWSFERSRMDISSTHLTGNIKWTFGFILGRRFKLISGGYGWFWHMKVIYGVFLGTDTESGFHFCKHWPSGSTRAKTFENYKDRNKPTTTAFIVRDLSWPWLWEKLKRFLHAINANDSACVT